MDIKHKLVGLDGICRESRCFADNQFQRSIDRSLDYVVTSNGSSTVA